MNKLFIPLLALLITSCTNGTDYKLKYADVDSIPRFTLEGFFTEDEQVLVCWKGAYEDFVLLRTKDSTYCMRNNRYINSEEETQLVKTIVDCEVRFYENNADSDKYYQIREDGVYKFFERSKKEPLRFQIMSYKKIKPDEKKLFVPEPYKTIGKWYDKEFDFYVTIIKTDDNKYYIKAIYKTIKPSFTPLTRKYMNGEIRYYESNDPPAIATYYVVRDSGLMYYQGHSSKYGSYDNPPE